MIYKIEGLTDAGWSTDSVGNDDEANTFQTEAEAQLMVPELAKIYDCPESDFRVREALK